MPSSYAQPLTGRPGKQSPAPPLFLTRLLHLHAAAKHILEGPAAAHTSFKEGAGAGARLAWGARRLLLLLLPLLLLLWWLLGPLDLLRLL